jgi:hypothetical protein
MKLTFKLYFNITTYYNRKPIIYLNKTDIKTLITFVDGSHVIIVIEQKYYTEYYRGSDISCHTTSYFSTINN